jgi:hypothetical protein
MLSMTNESNQIQQIYRLQKQTKLKQRKCMYTNCTNCAINSHLIQERILLDWICEGNHVFELNLDHFYTKEMSFHKVGIHKAISFLGFCSQHDNSLFKILESQNPAFSLYKNQILLSYRANANEMRKKEQIIDLFGAIFNENLFEPMDALHLQREYRFGFNNHKYQHNLLESELSSDIQNYTFHLQQLPKLPFATSALITLGDSSLFEMRDEFIKDPNGWTLCTIFFHIIPRQNSTIFLIGCHNQYKKEADHFLRRFLSSDESNLIHNIWTLLIRGAETWCCTPSFYQKHIKNREYLIIKEFQKYDLIEDYHSDMDIPIYM